MRASSSPGPALRGQGAIGIGFSDLLCVPHSRGKAESQGEWDGFGGALESRLRGGCEEICLDWADFFCFFVIHFRGIALGAGDTGPGHGRRGWAGSAAASIGI